MTSPCLGDEFSLDEGGRIQINLCGPPVDEDWPYGCSTRQNNGLHRNADGCLWVAPHTQFGTAAGVATGIVNPGFATYSTSKAVYSTNVCSLTVTNTDQCRPMDIFVHTDYSAVFTPTAVETLTQMFRQVTGVEGGDAGWTLVHTVDSATSDQLRITTSDTWVVRDLAPNNSRTVTVGIRVKSTNGSGTVNQFKAHIAGFVIAAG